MKATIFVFILITGIFLILSCTPPETPAHIVSVTSVQPTGLGNYSGAGSLPANKADALTALGQVFDAIGTAFGGAMADPNLTAVQQKAIKGLVGMLNPKTATKTITGEIVMGAQDVSGSVVFDNEAISYDSDLDGILDTPIGTIKSLNASFAAHNDPAAPPADVKGGINGNGQITASISLLPYTTSSGYTIEDAEINAAANADAGESYTLVDQGGGVWSPNTVAVNYNIGAALSAAFSISSDTFVGKFLVEFNFSGKGNLNLDANNPATGVSSINLVVTVHVYDNAGTEAPNSPFVYTADDLVSVVQAPV